MNEINYDKKMTDIISGLKARPRLLLHACCAPCASAALPVLARHFDTDILFFNPNITDFAEYDLRFAQLDKLLGIYNGEKLCPSPIKLIPSRYETSEFYSFAAALSGEKEGGARCEACFKLRLLETKNVAESRGYEYFCTTLTVSPHKNAALINRIGLSLEGEAAKFLPSDFKKGDGYRKSVEMSKKYGLYRQNFCGCEFSIRQGQN